MAKYEVCITPPKIYATIEADTEPTVQNILDSLDAKCYIIPIWLADGLKLLYGCRTDEEPTVQIWNA